MPTDCPSDQKAYVMDRARVSQQLSKPSQPTPPSAIPQPAGNKSRVSPVAGSAPLPVPTQRRAKEQENLSGASPRSPVRLHHANKTESPRSRRSSESSSNVDIGSMTPPGVTFAVGTPPNAAAFKGVYCICCVATVSWVFSAVSLSNF